MKTLVPVICAATLASGLFAQTAAELTTPCVYTNAAGETLNYRLYLPADIPAGKRLPFVFFMHGAGERGSDNVTQMRHGMTDTLKYIRSHEPAIVVAPQCPQGQMWVNTNWSATSHLMPAMPSVQMKLAIELLKEKLASLPVDMNRVYVTGISMGGYATWDLIQRMPDLFAAAMPVCGGGDATLAETLKTIPIWTFHGDQDPTVPVCRSRDMVKAIQACGGNIQYREYPGGGHNVWTPTYADPTTLDWLFAQKRTPSK